MEQPTHAKNTWCAGLEWAVVFLVCALIISVVGNIQMTLEAKRLKADAARPAPAAITLRYCSPTTAGGYCVAVAASELQVNCRDAQKGGK